MIFIVVTCHVLRDIFFVQITPVDNIISFRVVSIHENSNYLCFFRFFACFPLKIVNISDEQKQNNQKLGLIDSW